MYHSQQIHPGDRIVAVDDFSSEDGKHDFDLQTALRGSNVAGSNVSVTLLKLSG